MSTGRIGRGVGGAGIAAAAVAVATAAAPVLAANQSQAANQTDWGRIGRGAARVAGGVALGVGAVAVAILAPPVLAAGGLSALAGGGMLVGSGVAATYGFGQFSEGVNDISLGIHGFDDSVPAQNLIRDSFFGGDQQASDQLLLYSMTFMSSSELIFGLPGLLSNMQITRQNHLFRYWPTINPNSLRPGMDGAAALNPQLISAQERSFAVPAVAGIPGVYAPAFSYQAMQSLESIVANIVADRMTISGGGSGAGGSGGAGGGSQGSGNPVVIDPYDSAGNLRPNIRFIAGEFDYNYETDALGRLVRFQTDDLRQTTRVGRLPHIQDTPGKLVGDHAGHLAGDRFGGSPRLNNLVSQSSRVNLSLYKRLENKCARATRDGKNESVDVSII